MIIKKFEEIVGHWPGKTAIKTGSSSLTYRELDFKANRVAHAEAGKNKEPGCGGKTQQVALLFDYGIDMIVGILGTLKANNTYVPLDFSYPGKRLLYIIENAGVQLILTDNRNHELACELSAHAGKKINVLKINTIGDEIPGTPIHREASAERTAYILYTSGSTGKPKGVFQTHRNVMYYTRNWINRFSITESERMSLFTSFTHDGAVQDIFSALLSGACLYPYSLKQTGRVDELHMILAKEKITLWHSTPSLFRYFAGALTGKDQFPEVRWVLLGGEPLRAHDLELYKTCFPGAALANVYGQTESSVSTICVITPQDTFDDITLGEPLDETKILLIDEDGDMVEEMGTGEILVACDYIAPGYWQDEENSSKVFLQDKQKGRLYRTGDIGRFTAQGSIKAMGRKDFQVKVRGFRIELGEIETGLLQHYAVKEAIVIAKPDKTGDNYLCAYLVTSQPVTSEDLREYLFAELPDYMIPRYFIFMEKMPVTSTGKIDRRQLPEPEGIIDSRSVYVPPADEIEEQVAAIWQEVLNKEKIGVNDNFIELGGHSLLVMSIISKIHREMDVELKLTDVFANPTIKELSRLVRESKPTIFSPIIPVEKKEYYPLSSAQKRLYILQQMNPDSTAYNLPEMFPLPGGTDPGKINKAFKRGIKRHESLRTSFHLVNDTPVQEIHEHVEFEIEYYQDDISSFIRPFDLTRAPLLRVGLVELSPTPAALRSHPSREGEYILMVDMYHIISDGYSLEILKKDYQALYNEEGIPPLRLQYKDFAVWQEREREKGNLKPQEEFWLKEFEEEVPVLDLPYDYPRPLVQSFSGNIANFEISAEETRGLNVVAQQEGGTLFMVLAAVFNILLSKLSGQEDIVVGIPTAGRTHADLEKIIGMFVNTLALRNSPVGDRTFKQFQKHVKEKLLRVFENQEYPFEELVDKLSVKRDIGRNPLFDVMFISQNMGAYAASQDKETGIETTLPVQPPLLEEYEELNKTVKFDMILTVMASDRGLFLLLLYCTKLFKKETIERFILYFKRIVSIVVKDPGIKISDIDILPVQEKNRLLYEFNETAAKYPKNKNLHQLFEEQVERTPDHVALVGSSLRPGVNTIGGLAAPGDGAALPVRPVQLTYCQLNERSDKLAGWLIEKGVTPDTIVGIKLERTLEMIIGIMGILKSGGAYLPIDPDYPEERIDYMLKDSNSVVVLTAPTIEEPINRSYMSYRTYKTGKIPAAALAYVIYTSGSTGNPKGVMIEHRAVHNFMEGMARIIEFTPGKIILALTTITFDIFGLEILQPLCRGLKVVLADENHQREMGLLEQLIVKNCVGMMQATPSRMQMFTMTDSGCLSLKNLKELMVGGEALPVNLLAELKQSTAAKIYNMYGPTETTIWSTVKELTAAEEINIGTPIQNTVIYILDKYYQLQPPGVPGELCIGGDGLARGYINRPQLTINRFYRSHKSNKTYVSKTFYKTGDLARWLPGGDIQFLGRIDHQAKIRGCRVEPEEIEKLLLKHEQIKEAVVVIKDNTSLDKSLWAYLLPDTTASASPPKSADLREMLADKLPAYMIPAYFVILEKMPLTTNGKIDRKYLIESGPYYSRNETAINFVEPATDLEKNIAQIWKETLQIEEVGIHDNFFDLGGNSMKLIQLGQKLKNAFGIDIPVALMFRNLTINFLSKHLAPKEIEIETRKNRKRSEAMDRARNTFKDTIGKLIRD
jgi:amino acid adenylation domain-containing protein